MERLALLIVILWVACTPNAATFTLVNHSSKDAKVHVDERPYTVRASGFVNLTTLKGGTHYIKVGNAPVQTMILEPRRTTVMDLEGDGCYVVANYTPQYAQQSGGMITIDERFKKQPVFTTRDAMIVPYGDPLPSKVDVGAVVRRLHSVDCSIIEVDRAIIEAVARLP
jgi:hypothetical protein